MKRIVSKYILMLTGLLFLCACGNSTGDASSNVGDSAIPNEENTALDLDQELPSNSALDKIIIKIEGLDYSSIDTSDNKNMWKSSYVNVATNIRYVAPRCKDTASSEALCGRNTNTGLTELSPWDLLSTINDEQNVPSDTIIWMLPGDYNHPSNDNAQPLDDTVVFNIKLSGEYVKPIHFRPLPGAFTGENNGVRINGGFELNGEWIWIWEVETTPLKPKEVQSNANIIEYEETEWRPITTTPAEYFFEGVTSYDELHEAAQMRYPIDVVSTSYSKVINAITHKNVSGFGVWSTSSNFEVHGSIIYDNGYSDESRSHGHAFYLQNATQTTSLISDNISAGNMGNAMQLYASTENQHKLNDFHIIGNVFFAQRFNAGNGIRLTGESNTNVHVEDNFINGYFMTYPYTASAEYNANPNPDAFNRTCENNRMYELIGNTKPIDCESNTNEYSKRADDNPAYAVLRPNKYDARRANLMIFNPEQKDEVSIDLSSFAKEGDKIILLNSLDMKNPIAYSRYNGDNVLIPWPTPDWGVSDLAYIYFDSDIPKSQEGNLEKEFWAFVILNLGQ